MVSIKDWFYINGQKRRFWGKGETNLSKISHFSSNLAQWQTRSDIIRRGILKGLNLDPLPKKTPLKPVFHTKREYPKYSVENVYMEPVPGYFMTGTIYQPNFLESQRDQTQPLPVVLAPHGHKKDKRYTEDNQHLCASLARLGCFVFTWDMVGYADNTQTDHKILSAGMIQTWSSIRALDFILSDSHIPQIDSTRIGVTGGSGGGTQTFLLTAIDDRVTACAPVVMVSSFFFGGCICESGLPIHKTKDYATNNAEISAMAAPRPQLIVSDGGDWTRMTPIWEYPFIKRIYNLYGKGENLENVHLPNEVHDYGPSKRAAVDRFFAKIFGLDIHAITDEAGNINEGENVMEDVSLLKVFNEQFPRPDYALKSEKAICDVFRSLQ